MRPSKPQRLIEGADRLSKESVAFWWQLKLASRSFCILSFAQSVRGCPCRKTCAIARPQNKHIARDPGGSWSTPFESNFPASYSKQFNKKSIAFWRQLKLESRSFYLSTFPQILLAYPQFSQEQLGLRSVLLLNYFKKQQPHKPITTSTPEKNRPIGSPRKRSGAPNSFAALFGVQHSVANKPAWSPKPRTLASPALTCPDLVSS